LTVKTGVVWVAGIANGSIGGQAIIALLLGRSVDRLGAATATAFTQHPDHRIITSFVGLASRPTTSEHGTPGSPPTPRPCARTRRRAGGERTMTGPSTEEHTPAKYEVEIVTTWLIVGIPLAYGVFDAVTAALQLFG
jgi:hypothetical protein